MNPPDVAVIGAGPAGISAALAAAGSGASTLLIDENPQIGGQLRYRLQPTMDQDIGLGSDRAPGPEIARQLASRLESTENLTVLTGSVVWGLFENNALGISSENGADEVRASSIILATGSTDATLPFPGWTLPGVMTARAVQIFLHVHRVLPGQRWAILGESAEADELADDLERAGAEVVARLSNPDQTRASGTNHLAHVEYDSQTWEADALAIAIGRQPDAELALHAMADVQFDWDLGGHTALRGEEGETSVPGIYVAGDAAGIGSLEEVVAEGRLAGLAAAGASEEARRDARGTLEGVSSARRRSAVTRLRLNRAPAK